MLRRHRKPGWWMLYALIPLMGALLVLEHYASLSPRGHQFVQVGIVLFIYGLVWLWVNARAMAHDDRGEKSWEDADTANSEALRWPGSSLAQRHTYKGWPTVRHTQGCIRAKANGREIRKCSRNLGRQSSR